MVRHMPTLFETAIENEYFTQKDAGIPEIIFRCASVMGIFDHILE